MFKRLFALVAIAVCSSGVMASEISERLTHYGKNISSHSEAGKIRFNTVFQTTETAGVVWHVDFDTNAPELLTVPRSGTGQPGKLMNLAITDAWESWFCSAELTLLMHQYGINRIKGSLYNKGELQRMAVCYPAAERPASGSGDPQ